MENTKTKKVLVAPITDIQDLKSKFSDLIKERDLDTLALMIIENQKAHKEAEEKYNNFKEALSGAMLRKNIDMLDLNGVKVSLGEDVVKEDFDFTKFKKEYVEEYTSLIESHKKCMKTTIRKGAFRVFLKD